MDRKLTEQLQAWLNTPAEKRNIAEGANLVRRIIHNSILASNFERMPNRFMKMVEYQLGKFLPMRLAEATHEDVVRMTKQVEKINKEHKLDQPLPGKEKDPVERRLQKTEPFRVGKRKDHAKLPEEIQALYAENLHLMRQMRTCHAHLVILSLDEKHSSCPDGDRYPFVKEIIALDERYHANWEKYDNYGA